MDDIQKVICRLQDKPYMIEMGANKLAAWLDVSADTIREAKRHLREKSFMLDIPEEKLDPHKEPNILLLDIETAPLKVYVWRLWKQNVYIDQIVSDWFMLTWSAKWLNSPEMFSQRLQGREALLEDDRRIVETLWHLINKADIIVGHNCEKFDVPKIKSRFLVHGLPPTTFYQQIDTKKIAAKEFGFASNKLDALARIFGIPEKIHTDFTLWSACLRGEDASLRLMEEYNRHDVEILEGVYLKLRPYIKSHPNYNLFVDKEIPVCPSCGSSDMEFVGYYYFTQAGKYKNFRCKSCGALARERKSVYGNSKSILISNGK